jgi:hypothetical protein
MTLKMMSELKTLMHLNVIPKPTNVHKCMKVYYTHTVYLLHVLATCAHFQGGALQRIVTSKYCLNFLTITQI